MDKEYTPAEAKAWLAGYDAGKAFALNGWVWLDGEDIKNIEKWIEFKEAGGDEPVPLGKLVVYISDQLRKKNAKAKEG